MLPKLYEVADKMTIDNMEKTDVFVHFLTIESKFKK